MRAALSSAVGTLLLSAAVTGCTASGDTAAPDGDNPVTDPAAGLAVEVMQYRHDEVNRVLVVKVRNEAPERIIGIDSVQVEAPGFDGVGVVELTANLAPGRQFDLRVPYGEPDCSGERPAGDVVVRLGSPGSQSTREIVSPVGSSLLEQIRRRECSVARALNATPVRLLPGWTPAGSGPSLVVDGTLVVGPVAKDRQVQVINVEGSALFTLRAPRLPVQLAGGETTRLPVRVAPARCDPHAMADASKGFEFQVRVRLPGSPSDGRNDVLVPVSPEVAGKQEISRAWLERCGFEADPG